MRGYTAPPVPTEFPDIKKLRYTASVFTVCACVPVLLSDLCVCLCSDEELNKFLDDKESTVLMEDFVRNLDAVSLVQSHAHDDVMMM